VLLALALFSAQAFVPSKVTTARVAPSKAATAGEGPLGPLNGWVPDANEFAYGLPGGDNILGEFDPAGFLDGKLSSLAGQRVGVVLCGGNIDTPVLGRVIERGLAADGRIHRFTATVQDRPGGIAQVTRTLADVGASVKDIIHERASLKEDIAMVSTTVSIETRDAAHAAEVHKMLSERDIKFEWHGGSVLNHS